MALLRGADINTKPNMAKFLKDYVKCITGNPAQKPTFYPAFELPVNKWFVAFLDGHELIFDPGQKDDTLRYVLCRDYEDVELGAKGVRLVRAFFDRLFEFRFIGDSQSRIQQKAPETSGASDCV